MFFIYIIFIQTILYEVLIAVIDTYLFTWKRIKFGNNLQAIAKLQAIPNNKQCCLNIYFHVT